MGLESSCGKLSSGQQVVFMSEPAEKKKQTFSLNLHVFNMSSKCSIFLSIQT